MSIDSLKRVLVGIKGKAKEMRREKYAARLNPKKAGPVDELATKPGESEEEKKKRLEGIMVRITVGGSDPDEE